MKAWEELGLDEAVNQAKYDPDLKLNFGAIKVRIANWSREHAKKNWRRTIVNWINGDLKGDNSNGNFDGTKFVEAARRIREEHKK